MGAAVLIPNLLSNFKLMNFILLWDSLIGIFTAIDNYQIMYHFSKQNNLSSGLQPVCDNEINRPRDQKKIHLSVTVSPLDIYHVTFTIILNKGELKRPTQLLFLCC